MKHTVKILIFLLLVFSCGRSQKVYTEEERDAVSDHIEKVFGKYNPVLRKIVSPDIRVDICVIEPSNQRNYYTLVTMGMGAHKMNVPPEFDSLKIDRAELLITLPPDWDLNNSDETYYWPTRWLKIMATLPIERDTWLGWGHSVANGEQGDPFAENTALCGMIVTMPYFLEEKLASCELPNKELVRFYQLIQLYENEM